MQNKVLLAQTDTTVGFLSQNAQKLIDVKERTPNKPFLKVFSGLKAYRSSHGRIPNRFKREARRSTKTTYVVKNQAFRIVKDPHHLKVLKRFGWLYSTSANRSGADYDEEFAQLKSDIIIEDFRPLEQTTPSTILKLGHTRRKRLR